MNRETVAKELVKNLRSKPVFSRQKKTRKEKLPAPSLELKTVLDHIAEALIIVDSKGNILSANPAALALHGFKRWEDFPNTREKSSKLFEPAYLDGSPVPKDLWPVARALRGEKVMDFEVQVTRRDTGKCWVSSCNANPIFDEKGNITHVIVTLRDITERKRAEQALLAADQKLSHRAANLEKLVQERTAKLEENVEFLESFCYSIAHDLRAPVRAMQGFTRALLEDYAAAFDDTGKDYAQRIVDSAQRMDSLISDLLEYGRLSRQTFVLEPVNLNQEIETTLSMLSDRAEAANIKIAPLPKVLAHPTVVQQILHNLLSNALKFVEPGVSPQIKIWAETKDSIVRLWIQDNGIGLAPEFHEKIFGLFERLNSVGYPGTGMGLAIVSKAVQRMNGAVGVESELGRGSRFWVEFLLASENEIADAQKDKLAAQSFPGVRA